jgi:hypothetical protein
VSILSTLWTKTKFAAKLAFLAGFVKHTLLPETSVCPVFSVAEKKKALPALGVSFFAFCKRRALAYK